MKTVYHPTNTVCGGYNYDGLESLVLYTKFRQNQPTGSGEDLVKYGSVVSKKSKL